MKEYHAILMKADTTETIAAIQFMAVNNNEAVEIINKAARAFKKYGELDFIYHQHEKNTLNP